MRGKPDRYNPFSAVRRITPAHAGKTHSSSVQMLPHSDHPRACGENNYTLCEAMDASGSPPRMRGKHSFLSRIPPEMRITPAHAGKTVMIYLLCVRRTDHPRACGENGKRRIVQHHTPGSPPRMRGKQSFRRATHLSHRITPAHAGKTHDELVPQSLCADHPRACGENPERRFTMKRIHGSPPRMRGKLTTRGLSATEVRITPAHAGKTGNHGAIRHGEADHPRACGENVFRQAFGSCPNGSPPRMRGKRMEVVGQ